jgi:PAS domain S-box-containing protein
LAELRHKRKVKESMEKSEERYRELTDNLPEIVFEADLAGKITFFNQYAFNITGYSQEEFRKGLNMLQFVVPEQRSEVVENMKMSLSGKTYNPNEYTLLRRDGTIYPALVKTVPIISESKVIGLRGVVIDT